MEWNENDDEAICVRNRICCAMKDLVLNKILCTLRHFQSCRIGGMHSDKRNTCEFQIRKFIPKIDRSIDRSIHSLIHFQFHIHVVLFSMVLMGAFFLIPESSVNQRGLP